MNRFMSADFCCVPIWTPLVRYTSSGTRSPSAPICSSSCILSPGEPFLDPDELVELCDPLAADRTGLDCEKSEGAREVCDRVVRRLPAAVGHDGRVPVPMGQVDRGLRVGQRANLVRFYKDSVRSVRIDALSESRDARHEEVVADHEALCSDQRGEARVSGEIILVERILDAEQAKALREARDEVDLLLRRERSGPIPVHAVAKELGGREVEGGPHLKADLLRDCTAGVGENPERILVVDGRDPGAYVASTQGPRGELLPEEVAHGPVDTRVREDGGGDGRAERDGKELLNGRATDRVAAAADDVPHRVRHPVRDRAADIPV